MMLETPLAATHLELGARLVPFAGWNMPVSYADITTEHTAVRSAAGLFDLSHMGRVFLRGPDALALAQRIQTNDAAKLNPGRIRYAMMLNERGGIEDDILIYRAEDGFLLVVNAGNREADVAIMRAHAEGLNVEVDDQSASLGMIAVQGPRAAGIMESVGLGAATALKYYTYCEIESELGHVHISRTGYTGEDGFELIAANERITPLFLRLLEVGRKSGLIPCGLGARDTLRLEAGMPLHGHEIHADVNPLEAGLLFGVKFTHDFVGREALEEVQVNGVKRNLIGLDVEGPRIPREGCDVLAGDDVVGRVCSGTRSPTLGVNIATALVASSVATVGAALSVDIRGRRASATSRSLPFYRRKD